MNHPDQKIHEKISALLDDEVDLLEQDDILVAMRDDSSLANAWQRYHLIRAAVRREAIIHLPDLPEKMAPVLGSSVKRVRSLPPKRPTALKWIPGLALAASIAGIVGLGLFSFLPGLESGDPGRDAQVVEMDQGTKWETTSPDLEHTLNAFLVEHGEFTPMPNMNGLMAYARFVSYDSER